MLTHKGSRLPSAYIPFTASFRNAISTRMGFDAYYAGKQKLFHRSPDNPDYHPLLTFISRRCDPARFGQSSRKKTDKESIQLRFISARNRRDILRTWYVSVVWCLLYLLTPPSPGCVLCHLLFLPCDRVPILARSRQFTEVEPFPPYPPLNDEILATWEERRTWWNQNKTLPGRAFRCNRYGNTWAASSVSISALSLDHDDGTSIEESRYLQRRDSIFGDSTDKHL